jgi:hypothetical protein
MAPPGYDALHDCQHDVNVNMAQGAVNWQWTICPESDP